MDKPWLKRHTKALDRIMDEEFAQWHFDPMKKATDYIVVGNIKSAVGPEWDRIVRFAYDMDLTIEKSSIFDFTRSEDEDEDTEIIHNTGIIKLMGYDKSSASQFKTYSDIYPDLFYPILRESP